MYQNCCKKCGSTDLFTKEKGNNVGLYCSDCGAWIKWLSKDELRAFEHSQKSNNGQLNYGELREEIHKILCDFLAYECPLHNNGEFDSEFLEFRTDDILQLIKRQGGFVTKQKKCFMSRR